MGGVGLVGVLAGSVFGVLAKGTYDDARTHCPTGPTSCDSQGVAGGKTAHDQALLSDVGLAAGGLLVAAGAALYLTAPRTGHVTVSPTVGSTGAGISVVGGW